MKTEEMAVAYYTALGKKDLEAVSRCLHGEVQFTDPQETVKGKEAVLQAAKGFSKVFRELSIRTQFGAGDKAMVVYEVEIPGFAKKLQAASLLGFKEGLIASIELFYDASFFR